VTKESPCQVCTKPDWCSVSIDGKKAICRRRDIASAIAYCVSQPERVSINEVLIRPTQQAN
jgi:NADP-dependent 3-hydroxy acid dehydrogenase YdfG